jgi:hypothetical protein
LPKVFLEIDHRSEVNGELCERVLRCIGTLDENGGIEYIEPINYWVDDEVVLAELPDDQDVYAGLWRTTPYVEGESKGGVYSKLRDYTDYTAHSYIYPQPSPPPPPPDPDGGDGAGEGADPPDPPPPPPPPPDPNGPFREKFLVSARVNTADWESFGVTVCHWKGDNMFDDDAAYTSDEMAALAKEGYLFYIQSWYGTWYRKDLRVSQPYSGAKYRLIGVTAKSTVHRHYPVLYPENSSHDPVRHDFGMFWASGAPRLMENPTYTCVVNYQFYNSGQNYIAPCRFRMEKMTVADNSRLERWYMNHPKNKPDDDDNNFSPLADGESKAYTVERSGAYTGDGARLNVKGKYSKPSMAAYEAGSFGSHSLTIELLSPGLDYMKRAIAGINLHLWLRKDDGEYMYTVPVISARGADGMLVLKNPDGSAAYINPDTGNPYVVYEVSAAPDLMPPENGELMIVKTVPEITGRAVAVSEIPALVEAVPDEQEPPFLKKWTVLFNIKRDESGLPQTRSGFVPGDKLSVSWQRAQRAFNLDGVSEVVKILPVSSYRWELIYKGKFKRSVAGSEYYGQSDGKTYFAEIAADERVSESTLMDVANPNSFVYRVNSDETMGLLPTYWEWSGKEWKEFIIQVFPSLDAQVNDLQYVYTGSYFIIAGAGITPFTLKPVEGGLEIGALAAKTDVDVELTAEADFRLIQQNVVADDAVPVYFMRSPMFSPSVIAFINGRLWVSGLPDDPSKVYVSKPMRDKESRVFDFSTYKIFVTAVPQFTPFQARNDMGSDLLTGLDSGALGLMASYSSNPVVGAKVNYGFDEPFILATPYFTGGVRVTSVTQEAKLSAPSKALPKEYTEEAAADLRSAAAARNSWARTRVTVPGANVLVTADCTGFEVRVVNWHLMIGVSTSSGPIAKAELAMSWTAWGRTLVDDASVIAAATGAAATAGFGVASAAIGISTPIILASARAVTYALLSAWVGELSLKLTNDTYDNPSLKDLGLDDANVEAINMKVEYMLAKNKLYEPKQPFVMRRWKLEEAEVSTPDCGFVFKATSDEREAAAFIGSLRSIIVATESAERVMPSDVNGASQSAQTSSYLGAERLQAAAGADALYYMRKGGQSVMKAAYSPNVPVPEIADLQKYNVEILRGRNIVSLKAAKGKPLVLWCVADDGAVAVLVDSGAGGGAAWCRVSCGGSAVLDTAVNTVRGNPAHRLIAARDGHGVCIAQCAESYGESGDVFLDLWREYLSLSLLSDYGAGAVVYDSVSYAVVPASSSPPPEPGIGKYIGYAYTSRLRTLPAETANALRPGRVARTRFRFLESHLPFIKGFPSGESNRIVSPYWREGVDVPADGVADVPVPGNVELDAAYEVFSDVPGPLSIICVATEED